MQQHVAKLLTSFKVVGNVQLAHQISTTQCQHNHCYKLKLFNTNGLNTTGCLNVLADIMEWYAFNIKRR